LSNTAGVVERVPFADLSRQWRQIEAEAMPEIKALFEAGAFSLGPWVDQFEERVASYLGVPYAIGVNSGTSALHLAMIAAGVGRGDKVLVPANTFIATAWAVLYVGAEPILCDVTTASWTIDLADADRRVLPGVKAIVPVHLYGQPADMEAVQAFARYHGLVIIEDAAQAIGARFDGRSLGTIGQLGCFSFYPAKNLGAAGEAGLVVTQHADIAKRVRALRHHAQSERYLHHELGFNYRMEGLQGLVLGQKLRFLERWTEERRRVAAMYRDSLADLPLELPRVANGDHVWHLFVVHTPARDALRAHLAELGIATGLHYPVPLHRQPCFANRDLDRESFPNSDRNARECLSLPLFEGISEAEIARVIEGVRSYFRKARLCENTA
jgi:dTDP-4-amino-4,6-dideoxygalactose transaminase